MRTPNDERVIMNETGDETHSLTAHEPGDINSAISSLSIPVRSEELAGQIKEATDLLTNQLERLCDLKRELRQVPPRCNEEIIGFIPGSLRPRCNRSDIGQN